ncbi:oxidoreductase [Fulvitalea axinellae]|uniref:Oxidoreductase n=1 Tax=Fulvitalea axinellae TaxID=1182444 RepID=A0AAU9CK91_9BACT|nr:oxidoreductase [Fulvitalea axinellae]
MSSRRDILKAGGLAALGVLAGACSTGSDKKNKKSSWSRGEIKALTKENSIKIGVIGTGSRGTGLIHTCNKIPDFQVTACCDTLPFRLENGVKAARTVKDKDGKETKTHEVQAFSDYKEFLAKANVDAVIIATPYSTHYEIAKASIAAGKHLYCEKTLVHGVAPALHLSQLAEENPNIIFQTGHQHHNSWVYKKVVKMLKDGVIGDISHFECQWNRDGDWRRSVPEPKSKYERFVNWRMYKEFSGGLAAELSSHQIDFVNWVLGSVPTRIMGTGGVDYWKDGRETFDNIHFLADYPGGKKATFSSLTTNKFDGVKIRIKGKQGTLLMNHHEAEFLLSDKKKNEVEEKGTFDGVTGASIKLWDPDRDTKNRHVINMNADATVDALIAYRDAIVKGKQPVSNVKTGADVAIAVRMALESMHHGRIVHLEEEIENAKKTV